MAAYSQSRGIRPELHLVLDPAIPRARLLVAVAEASGVGVDVVHVRDRSATAAELLTLTNAVRCAVGTRSRVLVNDRLDVALAAGADGVQLPSHGLPVRAARRIAGASFTIGASTHTAEEAFGAEADGADFVLFGNVFPTRSHPGSPGHGIDAVRFLAERLGIPLIAIGGITARVVSPLISAGARGVAVISAVLSAPEPADAASELRTALDLATDYGKEL